MTIAIPFRRKIAITTATPVSRQIGKAQRGQWLWIDGVNARLLTIGKLVTVVRYDRDGRNIVQYH